MEAIACQETQQQDKAIDAAALGGVLGLDLACKQELRHTPCDTERNHPILALVLFPRDDDAPHHDRHHLKTLAKHLHREGDVLQCLILAPCCCHIGDGNSKVLPERCLVPTLFLHAPDHDQGISDCHEPVAQHQKD